MASLKSSVPLAKLMENDIQYLREWAKNRARNASTLPIEFLLKSDEEDL